MRSSKIWYVGGQGSEVECQEIRLARYIERRLKCQGRSISEGLWSGKLQVTTPLGNDTSEKLTFLSPKVIFSEDVKVATQPTGLVEVSV